MNHSFKEIWNVLQQCNTIAIGGHQNPDGDAIGSCFGLAKALQKTGKKIVVLLEDFGKKYDMIADKSMLLPRENYDNIAIDAFIAMDSGDKERLGDAMTVFDRAPMTINIDHHVSNTYYGTYHYVDGDASSTSEIIYQLLRDEVTFDKAIATPLYAGIVYDTAGFRHSSTSPMTMVAAGELMTYGVPANQIYTAFFDNRSFSELKLLGVAFEKAERFFENNVIFTSLTQEEIIKRHGTNKEVDAVVNFIRGVEGVQIACFVYEKAEGEIKVSFRGADGFDVCQLAQKFGGGGHVKAAGCTIKGSIPEAWGKIKKELEFLFAKKEG